MKALITKSSILICLLSLLSFNALAKDERVFNGYKVIVNQYPRKGEPDMYLITMFDEMATKAQEDKRYEAYIKWSKSTIAEMEEGSGERVVMRHLSGNSLLREVTFR